MYEQPLPPEYVDQPEVWPEIAFFWNAFHELDTDRQIGFAEGPIPFTAIDTFARRYRIQDMDEFDRFVTIMRGMDAEQRAGRAKNAKRAKELNEKLDAEQEDAKPKRPPKPLAK